jgi:hypothetical protein
VGFLVAAQIKEQDEHSYSKVTKIGTCSYFGADCEATKKISGGASIVNVGNDRKHTVFFFPADSM